ncbi:MAG: hypothetical protein LBB84_07060 [Tannerellaceae bacterium]|jgi:hypothetical protein|nr:hypothetical protein [Tannerellaceae bacterium]
MGKLENWLEKWEKLVAQRLSYIVKQDREDGSLIVDADEVCFFGTVRLPITMADLKKMEKDVLNPQIYIVGMKNGEIIPYNIWGKPEIKVPLKAQQKLYEAELAELVALCEEEGVSLPTSLKVVADINSGEFCSRYSYHRLPFSPFAEMTIADWAFDLWILQIQEARSAFRQVQEDNKKDQEELLLWNTFTSQG